MSEPDRLPAPTTLLADIGGTNARFAILCDGMVGEPEHFATRDYASPIMAIRSYLATISAAPPARAVIAAAGPVKHGHVHMTNADWTLDAAELARELHLESVELINDFAAQAWAVPALPADALRAIGGGVAEPGGPQAVIGAGTGFGMAVRAGAPGLETIIVTEGGHATLAADNEMEDAVLRNLRARFGHVSVERVFSGPGLVDLYRQLALHAGVAATARDTAEIVALGLAGTCSVSRATLEMFCGWLGGAAGDIALTTGAVGGVYLAGGVVLHFLDFLAASTFRQRFEAKGRLTGYVAAIPTLCVTHRDPAFLGLTRYVACGQAKGRDAAARLR
jgi:glucokinase